MAVERIKEDKERKENDDKGLEYPMINSLPAGSKAILTKDSNSGFKALIPDGVTSIGLKDFYDNQLTSIVIPDSVTTIGFGAFAGNQLKSVVIPNSVKRIGQSAFQYNQLKSVVIPDSVTSLGVYAFYNNQLTSIVIPDSVTRIYSYAFAWNEWTEIIFEGEIPPTIQYNTFDNNPCLNAIYVPDNAVETYKKTDNYEIYVDIIKPISERPTKQRSKGGEVNGFKASYFKQV